MLRQLAKIAPVVLLAAAIYLFLAIQLVNYGFGNAPGFEFMKANFGPLAGGRVWTHLVYASALAVAALPSAIILALALRPRAVTFAAVSGVIAAIAGIVPTFLHPNVLALLDAPDFVRMGTDSLIMTLILVLLTWLLAKLPSNSPFGGIDISRGK
jgi:hypothetical protein